MKGLILLFAVLLCISCENRKKDILNKPKSITRELKNRDNNLLLNQIDFNKSPVNIKKLISNESKYYVTSSAVDKSKISGLCNLEKYGLERSYNILLKNKDFVINELKVKVKIDKNEWNRENADETFKSILVKDNSINLWDSIFVGMKISNLLHYLKLENYKKYKDSIVLKTKIYRAVFRLNQNKNIHQIYVEKFCDLKSKYSQNESIPNQIKIKSFEENPPKEIIIPRESITEYLDFAYSLLNKEIQDNKVTFSKPNINIQIKKVKFINKESYVEDSFKGVNYDFPNEIISSLKIAFDDKLISNEKILFLDLAEPNFNLTKAYQIDKENILIEMHNSDGAAGYAAYIFVNKNGNSKRYLIYP